MARVGGAGALRAGWVGGGRHDPPTPCHDSPAHPENPSLNVQRRLPAASSRWFALLCKAGAAEATAPLPAPQLPPDASPARRRSLLCALASLLRPRRPHGGADTVDVCVADAAGVTRSVFGAAYVPRGWLDLSIEAVAVARDEETLELSLPGTVAMPPAPPALLAAAAASAAQLTQARSAATAVPTLPFIFRRRWRRATAAGERGGGGARCRTGVAPAPGGQSLSRSGAVRRVLRRRSLHMSRSSGVVPRAVRSGGGGGACHVSSGCSCGVARQTQGAERAACQARAGCWRTTKFASTAQRNAGIATSTCAPMAGKSQLAAALPLAAAASWLLGARSA